ncbi:NAD(P)-binding protein [Rhizopogon salebrosus TDB-379]|nr:NAD(P)-binding protein [Rhizopogon salebrosus TDB-379]
MPSLDRGPSPFIPSFRRFESMSHVNSDVHPVLHAGRVAVITGAASGIGKAAAVEMAKLGLKIAMADVVEDVLVSAAKEVITIAGEANVLVIPTDVSSIDDVVRLRDKVYEAWGEVAVLLNNAAVGPDSKSWEMLDNWKKTFDVNLFGVVNSMLYQENQAMVINTGSKQGITNPPGNPAYNAAKAAVKSLTEGLAHELRERPACNVTAHLFIPGWTFTGLSARSGDVKPTGAWTAEETVLFMLDHVRAGEFYILCPDNETRRELDQLRTMWAAGDVAEGRPALSRWHRDWKSLFEEYIRDGLANLE